MSFVSKNLQQTTNAMSFIKGATLFFLGMSAVLFLTQAFDIVPVATEVKGYFKTIILTSNGSNTAATGIELDGNLGRGHFVGDVDVDSSVNANTVNATTINGTTIKGTMISGATVKGTTVCVNGDCRTSRPSGGTVIGGDSVWSTGASNVAYYNLGNVGIGINIPTARLQVSGSVLFKDYLTFSTNAYIYPVIEQDSNGKSLNIYAGGVLDENGGPWVGGSLNLKGGDITDSQGSSGGSVYINGGAGTESGNIILGNIAGKVGIGTTSPSELLHVNGNTKTTKLAVGTGIDGTYTTNIDGSVKITNAGSTPIGDIYTNNGYYETYIGKYQDEDGDGVGSASNYGMIIHALNTVGVGLRVAMQNPAGTAAQLMGRVGIGTTTPSQLLHLSGSTNNITLQNSGHISAGTSTNQLYLGRNGNVGIGTASPSAKLTVSGGAMSIYGPDGSTPDFQFQTQIGNVGVLGMYFANGLNDNIFLGGLRGTVLGTISTTGIATYSLYVFTGGKVSIGTTYQGAKLNVDGGIKMAGRPTNPCTNTIDYPEGTMFYNSTDKYFCFCDHTTTAKAMNNPTSICY